MTKAKVVEHINTSIHTGTGKALATCGELLQGQFNPDEDFLVTFPLDWYSTAAVSLFPNSTVIDISPSHKTKTKIAAQLLLQHAERTDLGAEIKIESSIPAGKGLGSSTADITAACRAIGKALDIPISPKLISAIALEIEPSDGSMYHQVVCYNHRECKLIELIGKMPPCSILIVDLGGKVDTVEFNKQAKNYNNPDYEEFRSLYDELKSAFHNKDIRKISSISTRSARINQRILYKPELEQIVEIANSSGAYGICAAHSGTIVGMIYDRGSQPVIEKVTEILTREISKSLHMLVVDSH